MGTVERRGELPCCREYTPGTSRVRSDQHDGGWTRLRVRPVAPNYNNPTQFGMRLHEEERLDDHMYLLPKRSIHMQPICVQSAIA